jgi:hypothetical protein
MSLGNYPLVNPVNPSQNSQGLNSITPYFTHVATSFQGANPNITAGTFNYGVLTTGCVKIVFCYVTGLTVTNASSTAPQTAVDVIDASLYVDTNAASLVRVEDTFPTNEVSGVVGSGIIIPFNGSETTQDNWLSRTELEEYTYPNAPRPQDATWKDESLEYTSNATNAVYSHSMAQSITDPETNQLETGIEEGYETAPDSAYVNTFNPETNDVLAFDEAAGEAQWVPAEDLEPNPQAIQQIQQAATIILPFAFECGAVIFQPNEPAAAGITVTLAQLGTAPAVNGSTAYESSTNTYEYDCVVITATQDVSNITMTFIMIGV